MKYFVLIIIALFAFNSLVAQTDINWSKDLDLPYTDSNGNALTGTEIIHIVTHKGKLYAGNSYWNENTVPRRGQVWVKNTHDGNWLRDYQMPTTHSRVPSLYSFTFQRNYLGANIASDTILFAGATFDKGSNINGPAVIFMRDDSANNWVSHNLGFTNHAFAYTQIRSMGFHRDKVTGVDIVFAGANPAPTGVYAGKYNASVVGKIQWDATPEFIPSGYQRIMGFAVCNDTLYMATQREVYKRIDGSSPSWVLVLNLATPSIISTYGSNIDPYWLNDEDIRCFRTIKNPSGQDVLMFGALNHIFRLEPQNNYQLIAEQDLEDVLEISTGHDIHYIQTQIIKDYTNPITNETRQLIGFEAFYDTTYLANNPQPNLGGFNQQGWYFERKQVGTTITYTQKEILDYNMSPQPDSLARVRTFEISPFPQDSGKVIYSGGFAPWFIGGVTNTAWIYKGTLSQNPINGNTAYTDINYIIGTPQNQLNLDVFVPNGGSALKPVMIYVHGGSWRTGDKSQTGFKDEFFTNNDYIFVSINYRLSPNPINLSDPTRVMFPDHPEDIAKAIKWVFNNISSYGGDTSKVSMIGHSAGAHLVSLVSTDETYLNNEGLQLSQLKCACSLDAGAYDINYYMNTYESPGSSQWNTYENAFGSDTSNWANASPINHLAPNKGIPDFMLVHQGTTQRIDLATRFGNALTLHTIPKTMLNASPLDHEGINQVLGSTNTLAQIYNDSVLNFFSNCLNNSVLAINELGNINDMVVVYPNPTNSFITLQFSDEIKFEEILIEVYNLQGSLLRTFVPKGNNQNYDLSKFPNGTYLVTVRQNGKILTTKVFKN
jgi:acetyl esterase/lipase